MSAELNKILCAILSAILVFLLASFIGELLYHPVNKTKKLSYQVETADSESQIEKAAVNETDNAISKEEIQKLLLVADLKSGEKFVTKNCSACHTFTLPVKNKIGPSLAILLDRKVGSMEGYNYSKSFKSINKDWSHENLFFFLQKPKTWAPGTKMSYRGISKRDDLINTLKYLSHISKLNEG